MKFLIILSEPRPGLCRSHSQSHRFLGDVSFGAVTHLTAEGAKVWAGSPAPARGLHGVPRSQGRRVVLCPGAVLPTGTERAGSTPGNDRAERVRPQSTGEKSWMESSDSNQLTLPYIIILPLWKTPVTGHRENVPFPPSKPMAKKSGRALRSHHSPP